MMWTSMFYLTRVICYVPRCINVPAMFEFVSVSIWTHMLSVETDKELHHKVQQPSLKLIMSRTNELMVVDYAASNTPVAQKKL